MQASCQVHTAALSIPVQELLCAARAKPDTHELKDVETDEATELANRCCGLGKEYGISTCAAVPGIMLCERR